ncbi:hypothetical protein SAMN04488544_2984 [Microlunatus sagamiharensis]|uniref:Uncharacterized protein n=1 Tax=Microlunatus sagamiharensis TaxID=546874 RepID=A0A1H2MZV0_9ACTN|nr:DUF6297 family protein [Microlunatus sagamiharensis]SDU98365.1 hypothetical protein SAMN04488544_2984 [Microlunatus sagamiharensis]
MSRRRGQQATRGFEVGPRGETGTPVYATTDEVVEQPSTGLHAAPAEEHRLEAREDVRPPDDSDDGPDVEPTPSPALPAASPRELRGLMKDWRRGRATRNLGQALSDAYVAVIAALMLGAMTVNVIIKAQRVVADCSSASCLSARALLPWAAVLAAVATALAVARLFGPVLASAAEGFWLLDAPVSRSKLLRSRLVAALVGALVGGAVIGGLISLLTGSGGPESAVWAVATGLSASAAVAASAAQQGRERHRLSRAASFVFGLLGVVALLGVVGVAADWFTLRLSTTLGTEIGAVVAGLAVVLLLGGTVLAASRLSSIRRTRLVSGGSLVKGISGAFFALDIGLARDIVVQRRTMEVGHVTPRRGHGEGLQALTWREWQRLRRFPQPLVAWAGTIVVPYASEALGLSAVTPVFGALALFGATVPMLNGLRVLTRTGGLARCLPFSMAQIKLAVVTAPAILAAVWAVAVGPAFAGVAGGAAGRTFGEASLMAVATAAAGLLAAIRWTQAKGVDFSKPMVSTQAGALPPGLVTNLFRGFDVCLLATAPMLLGFSPLWSLAIEAITAIVLFNSFDAESMQAKQKEAQRQMDLQKRERESQAAMARQRKR